MDKNDLTQSELRELLVYNPFSGIFKWRVGRGGRTRGQIAGTVNNRGYVMIKISSYLYSAHRLAWLYVYGEFPVLEIDHIDRNKTNNKKTNLRQATHSQNLCNSRTREDNTTGVKGVAFMKTLGLYRAYVKKSGRAYIKDFITLEDAAAHVTKIREEVHGEFSCDG